MRKHKRNANNRFKINSFANCNSFLITRPAYVVFLEKKPLQFFLSLFCLFPFSRASTEPMFVGLTLLCLFVDDCSVVFASKPERHKLYLTILLHVNICAVSMVSVHPLRAALADFVRCPHTDTRLAWTSHDTKANIFTARQRESIE